MTRKDFEAIAWTFNYEREIAEGFGERVTLSAIDMMACSLANTFEQSNERFDRARFLAACGLPA